MAKGNKKEAKIVVVAHHKGGVGKSMIAINLAHALRYQNYKVALIDIDTQGTTKRLTKNIDVFSMDEDVDNQKYNVIIIDTPPYLSTNLSSVFEIADFVIIPARPNPSDFDTVPETIKLFNQAKIKNPKLKGGILINQNQRASSIWDEIKPFFEQLDFRILNTVVENRVSYARSVIEDKGIFSQDDKKAQQEMTNLAIEVLKELKL